MQNKLKLLTTVGRCEACILSLSCHPEGVPRRAARACGRWLYRCEGARVSGRQLLVSELVGPASELRGRPAVALPKRPDLLAWSLLNHMRCLLKRVVQAAAVSHVAPSRPPPVSHNVAPLLRLWGPPTKRLRLCFETLRPQLSGNGRDCSRVRSHVVSCWRESAPGVCVMRTAR